MQLFLRKNTYPIGPTSSDNNCKYAVITGSHSYASQTGPRSRSHPARTPTDRPPPRTSAYAAVSRRSRTPHCTSCTGIIGRSCVRAPSGSIPSSRHSRGTGDRIAAVRLLPSCPSCRGKGRRACLRKSRTCARRLAASDRRDTGNRCVLCRGSL